MINLDANWLRDLVDTTHLSSRGESTDNLTVVLDNEDRARILLIAQHLESMEEKLVNLQSHGSSYEDGLREGQRRLIERSNFPAEASREIEDGAKIFAEIKSFQVTKVPRGKSGLAPEKPKKKSGLEGMTLDLTSILGGNK